MKIEAAKGKSPYSKHQKAPYQYGEHYQRWASAIGQAGATYGSETAQAADAAFRRAHHIPTTFNRGQPIYG